MPCRDGGPCDDDSADIQGRLDLVTRFLCEVLSNLEDQDKGLRILSDECAAWWLEHKAEDAARRLREEKQAQTERRRKQDRIERLEAELAALKGAK